MGWPAYCGTRRRVQAAVAFWVTISLDFLGGIWTGQELVPQHCIGLLPVFSGGPDVQ